MLRETYEQIKSGVEVRKNLINLKQELKQSDKKMAFLYYLAGDYTTFYRLIEDEDAKVRKNVALIMGELGVQSFLKVLFYAYETEEKLFVKADYLTAMSKLDYREIISELKERLEFLISGEFEETSLKHINEEKRILTNMILKLQIHRYLQFFIWWNYLHINIEFNKK